MLPGRESLKPAPVQRRLCIRPLRDVAVLVTGKLEPLRFDSTFWRGGPSCTVCMMWAVRDEACMEWTACQ